MSSLETDGPVDTRSRIIEAAAGLLRDGGSARVTTRAVAQAAKVPAPTIFRLFGDKDGLMNAVAEHVMATYAAAKSAQALQEDGDPVEDLRRAWRLHVDFGLANPDLFVLLNSSRGIELSPATTAGVRVLEARIARVGAAGHLAVPDSQAVSLIHAAGTGAVFALLHQSPDNRDTSLPDTMLEAVLGAILTTAPAPPTSTLAPLTIAFRAAIPDLPALSDRERALLTEWVDRSLAGSGN